MREFFGFGGYERTPEGYMSFAHLFFVSTLMAIMIGLSIFLGLKNKNKDDKTKNKVLIWAAILIDAVEIFKLTIFCIRDHSVVTLKNNLPLFLCSIQLIAIPVAAFSKGRIKEACLDFVFIFGILGAVLGTYGAGQNYNAYPVLGIENVASGITHSIAGFASLYIVISGMASMKKENILITFSILIFFCILAFVANSIVDYNYMFLRRGDGTPYDIFYNLVNVNQVLYPMIVVTLFILYITVFYVIFLSIRKHKQIKEQ